jgi:hypothetical protein
VSLLLDVPAGGACMEQALRTGDPNSSWARGVEGEQETALRLSALGDEWSIYHALPIGPGRKDLDHLVIGPTGVFAINSKHRHDKDVHIEGGHIRYGLDWTNDTQSVGLDAQAASAALSNVSGSHVPVTGVISLVCPGSVHGDSGQSCAVLEADDLVDYLLSQPVIYNSSEVATLDAVVQAPGTWRGIRSNLNGIAERYHLEMDKAFGCHRTRALTQPVESRKPSVVLSRLAIACIWLSFLSLLGGLTIVPAWMCGIAAIRYRSGVQTGWKVAVCVSLLVTLPIALFWAIFYTGFYRAVLGM